MTEKSTQGEQQELFSGFASEPRSPERIPAIAKTQKPILISTTLEQILLVSIVSILVLCLVFFLGVLRGRFIGSAMVTRPAVVVAPRPVLKPVAVASQPPIPARPASPQLSTSSTKPYTIQVLTTKKKAYADEEALGLRKSGFNSWSAKSGEYYIVCVGSYATKEEARKDLSYFGSRYKGRYLRRK